MPGPRRTQERLTTAKGRRLSSTRWLSRQLNDPYVAEARRLGYRGRAAFKLIEIDDRFHLLKPGARVLDLGAAPGGWSQVAAARVAPPRGRVLAVDLAAMAPLAGVEILTLDLLAQDADRRIRAALGGPVDVVLSDMAPAASGHRETDHLRSMALAEAALALAVDVLKPGGALLVKVLQGGGEAALIEAARRRFATVRRVKPKASRSESVEFYLLATGFRTAEAEG
jgi:23S rRNA (uridine2552-2'-O)-methyltransferase